MSDLRVVELKRKLLLLYTHVIKVCASDLCCGFRQRAPLTQVINKAYASDLCCGFGQRTPFTQVIKAYMSDLRVVELKRELLLLYSCHKSLCVRSVLWIWTEVSSYSGH
jgi:hypothetical protein